MLRCNLVRLILCVLVQLNHKMVRQDPFCSLRGEQQHVQQRRKSHGCPTTGGSAHRVQLVVGPLPELYASLPAVGGEIRARDVSSLELGGGGGGGGGCKGSAHVLVVRLMRLIEVGFRELQPASSALSLSSSSSSSSVIHLPPSLSLSRIASCA